MQNLFTSILSFAQETAASAEVEAPAQPVDAMLPLQAGLPEVKRNVCK